MSKPQPHTTHISELDLDVMYPDKFLKAAHLVDAEGRPVSPVVVLESVKQDLVAMSGGKKALATVLTFKGKSKAFISNKTNSYAIATLLGSKRPVDWIGKRIRLVVDIDENRNTRQDEPCIRVGGSPDATPEQASAFARCWKGERKGGALCSRLKLAVARLAIKGPTAPVEALDPERDEPAQTAAELPPIDDWSDGDDARGAFDPDARSSIGAQPTTNNPSEGDPGPPMRQPGDDEDI